MRMTVVVLLILFFPLTSSGHPGKTDLRGGHRCLKGCAEWDLLFQEYHLHDKQGRAVKVVKQRKRTAPVREAVAAEMPADLPAPAASVPHQAPPATRTLPVPAGDHASAPLPLMLVLMLLLLLLVRRGRTGRRGAGHGERQQ